MRGVNLRGAEAQDGVTLISYRGEVVASAGATRLYLAPRVLELPADDAVRSFVSMMAVYALRVREGTAPGPYTHERAERFARLVLIDDDEFRMLAANRLDDRLLAGHFAVPIEQVPAKRDDLSLPR